MICFIVISMSKSWSFVEIAIEMTINDCPFYWKPLKKGDGT